MKQIILSPEEKQLLVQLMDKTDRKDAVSQNSYEILRTEIKEAVIMECEKIPEKVIRLNSKFDIKTPNRLISSYQLVLPKESNINEGKLSILAPMGIALIGYEEGDEVMWKFPAGEMMITIINVENSACQTISEEVF